MHEFGGIDQCPEDVFEGFVAVAGFLDVVEAGFQFVGLRFAGQAAEIQLFGDGRVVFRRCQEFSQRRRRFGR